MECDSRHKVTKSEEEKDAANGKWRAKGTGKRKTADLAGFLWNWSRSLAIELISIHRDSAGNFANSPRTNRFSFKDFELPANLSVLDFDCADLLDDDRLRITMQNYGQPQSLSIRHTSRYRFHGIFANAWQNNGTSTSIEEQEVPSRINAWKSRTFLTNVLDLHFETCFTVSWTFRRVSSKFYASFWIAIFKLIICDIQRFMTEENRKRNE